MNRMTERELREIKSAHGYDADCAHSHVARLITEVIASWQERDEMEESKEICYDKMVAYSTVCDRLKEENELLRTGTPVVATLVFEESVKLKQENNILKEQKYQLQVKIKELENGSSKTNQNR